MTDSLRTVKAAEDNISNVSTISTEAGKTGKVFGYEEILGDLGKMTKEFMDSIESKVTTKLEEVSKKMEEISEDLKEHKKEEARHKEESDSKDQDVDKGTTGAPYERKPAGTRLEEDDERKASSKSKVVYRPIFVSPRSGTTAKATSRSEEEISKKRENRQKRLEEVKTKMEQRRKKLAYEASQHPVAKGKAQQASTEDSANNPTSGAMPLVQMPGQPNVQVPAWMAEVMKSFSSQEKSNRPANTFQG